MEWAIRARNGTCRRRNLRIDVEPAIRVLLRSDEGEFPGEILDISLGGARVSAAALPPSAVHIDLMHEDVGDIRADVKWCDGGVVGVAFDPAPPAVALLTQCLRRLMPSEQSNRSPPPA